MNGVNEFRNDEIFIQHHYRPREGTPFYIVYCNNASRGVFTPEEVEEIAAECQIKTLDQVRSFLLSQSLSIPEEQSHQEAAE